MYVGLDVVHVARISRLLRGSLGDRFLRRAFHPTEISRWKSLPEQRADQFLAARWAAKEALLKAIGAKRIPFPEIQVVVEPEQDWVNVRLELQGKARDYLIRKGVENAKVSLSHDGDYATAIVILY